MVEASTQALLRQAVAGDRGARDALFARHRAQLLRIVELRIDRRLRPRVDPADVVQDVYLEASRRFDEVGEPSDVAFTVWLRLLATQRLAQLWREHLGAQGRDLRREAMMCTDHDLLTQHLSGHLTSPSGAAIRAEERDALHAALEVMAADEREILVLRHFEQLSGIEAAAVLGISRAAASKRYVRALARLAGVMSSVCGED